MGYRVTPMSYEAARAICGWRYEGPYAIYNTNDDSDEAIAEMLDPRSPYVCLLNSHNDLIGFFAYGTAGEPRAVDEPHTLEPDGTLTIGLGMRPDRTGRHLGVSFVEAGLAYGQVRFAPTSFRLFVLAFNVRAILVYEYAGFRRVGSFTRETVRGEHEFIEMRRDV